MRTLITIKRAADLFGVHPDTLRSWEENNLIKPQRTAGGHRRYDMDDIRKMLEFEEVVVPLLTIPERMFLINQLEILKHVDPKAKKGYDRQIEAVQQGYESEYPLEWIDKDILSDEQCNEVAEILNMYWLAQQFYDKVKGQEDIFDLNFPGFSENFEQKQMGYARWLCDDKFKFEGLRKMHHDFGSFTNLETLPMYRKQLEIWGQLLRNKPISSYGLPINQLELWLNVKKV